MLYQFIDYILIWLKISYKVQQIEQSISFYSQFSWSPFYTYISMVFLLFFPQFDDLI